MQKFYVIIVLLIKVFFTNSGAEAIEAGLKVVRSYHYHNKNFHKKILLLLKVHFMDELLLHLSAQRK